VTGGSGIMTPLLIELSRIYGDMSQSSGTPYFIVPALNSSSTVYGTGSYGKFIIDIPYTPSTGDFVA
jgi:hypothetical protein